MLLEPLHGVVHAARPGRVEAEVQPLLGHQVQALGLAQSLGFAAPSVRTEASAFMATSGARELVLYKASGGFDYVNRATYGKAPAAPLPTKAEARRAAIDSDSPIATCGKWRRTASGMGFPSGGVRIPEAMRVCGRFPNSPARAPANPGRTARRSARSACR